MENILYEHDYSEEHAEAANSEMAELCRAVFERAKESGFFKAYDEAMKAYPKIINPVRKQNFDFIRDICDDMASRLGGKIRAEIRYDKWDGIIDLTLPFIEFGSDEDMKKLQEISKRADSVTFNAEENNQVRMHIFCYYFEDIVPEGTSAQLTLKLLSERPEMAKALLEKMRYEAEMSEESENFSE